jgi:hypothetical protein
VGAIDPSWNYCPWCGRSAYPHICERVKRRVAQPHDESTEAAMERLFNYGELRGGRDRKVYVIWGIRKSVKLTKTA